jgi:hypothetical protein
MFRMKWVWIVLGTLAAAIALVSMIGAMQPVKHVATRRARFRATPEAVWKVMSPGTSQTHFKQDDVNYDVLESVPPARLVTKIADKLPYGGQWTYELTPDGSGTNLVITEDGEVYNPIFRFVSRFVMGHTATIDASLRDLGKKLGEEVKIEN